MIEVRVHGRVSVEVDASGTVDVEADEVGTDYTDEEMDGRIGPCLSFASLALGVGGWLTFGLRSSP